MKKLTINKIVEFVIVYCSVRGVSVTPMKLQKIIYYIQAWHIAYFDRHPLFDELPEAWVNGPVYRSVYDTFKDSYYRSAPITLNESVSLEDSLVERKAKGLNLTDEQLRIVNSVLKHYAPFSEAKLVLMTHTDSPWNEARKGLSDFDRCEQHISVESMYSFYGNKLKK